MAAKKATKKAPKSHWSDDKELQLALQACSTGWNQMKPVLRKYATIDDVYRKCTNNRVLQYGIRRFMSDNDYTYYTGMISGASCANPKAMIGAKYDRMCAKLIRRMYSLDTKPTIREANLPFVPGRKELLAKFPQHFKPEVAKS